MSRKVFRYVVPVAEGPIRIGLRGDIVHVAARTPHAVEFWAIHDESVPEVTAWFLVAGTGHPLEEKAIYVGTAIPMSTPQLVWHLFKI